MVQQKKKIALVVEDVRARARGVPVLTHVCCALFNVCVCRVVCYVLGVCMFCTYGVCVLCCCVCVCVCVGVLCVCMCDWHSYPWFLHEVLEGITMDPRS